MSQPEPPTASPMRRRIAALPFRIGTTSYIIEAGLLENLMFLSSTVSEMQMVLFDVDGYTNIPTAAEAETLRLAAADRDMAFTVHLPGSIALGAEDPEAAERSAELFRRTVAATQALSPICWTLHAICPTAQELADPDRLRAHYDRTGEALAPLLDLFDSPRCLAVENVFPHFHMEGALIEAFDTSVCIDVGHLLADGVDVDAHLARWLPRCRNMHLHGVDAMGQDHTSLAHLPAGFLAGLLTEKLAGSRIETITIEVFGEADFDGSIAALQSLDIWKGNE